MVNKIKETIVKFCELMMEKEPDTLSIKITVETKGKVKIKYKQFREYGKNKV